MTETVSGAGTFELLRLLAVARTALEHYAELDRREPPDDHVEPRRVAADALEQIDEALGEK